MRDCIRPLRSLLFVPGDSEKKLARIAECGADAVILDLEDSVAPERKAIARELVSTFLKSWPDGQETPQVWVRINPFHLAEAHADLAAVVPGRPAGIMQPKVDGPSGVLALSEALSDLEAQNALREGEIRIIPVVTETPISAFNLGKYAEIKIDRLAGLTWGAEDLATALGASTNKGADGQWALAYRIVRSLTLLAAGAAGVPAYETLHADFRDIEGLIDSSREARGEGWSGRIAIHPCQVDPINRSFTPDAKEVREAWAIVNAFAAQPGAGTVSLDGRMLDWPHLRMAERMLQSIGGNIEKSAPGQELER